MSKTIASVLRRTGGRAPGVAQTRALLVFAWIAFQSVRLTDGYGGAVLSPLWIVPHAVVPALFAVLGFCLAKAAAEQPIRGYVLDRARSAGPVLVAAVAGSALAIGPLVTTGGLGAYVSDPAFALYFANLVGWPQFVLPGVFEFNDYAAVVNEALWLTPCFVIAALSILATMRSRTPRWFTLLAAAVTLVVYAAGEATGLIPSPGGSVIRDSYVASALAAIFAGQCGAACHVWRDRLPVGWPVLTAAGFALGALAVLGGPDSIDFPGVPIAIALAAGAAAVAAMMSDLPAPWLARRAAPVLHGAMLFSFPLQQLVLDQGPGGQGALVNLALALPPAVAAAWALHWVVTRVGLTRAPGAPEPDETALPVSEARRSRSWRSIVRQSAEGLGIALVVAVVGLVIILLTVSALQSDPIGV